MLIFDLLLSMGAQKYLRSLDVQFARLMANQGQPHLALAAALVSLETASGHVCLPLSQLSLATLTKQFPDFALELSQLFGGMDEAAWQACLLAEAEVSDGSYSAPLVLQNQRLYLQRLWQDEGVVATFFAGNEAVQDESRSALQAILSQLFPARSEEAEVNWQQVAAAVAATRRVSVISGGPGTGKTTTVARLLTALVRLHPQSKLRIQLAAPTGKAAARLTESLGKAIEVLGLTPTEREVIPQEAYTLHRLLGAQPNSIRLRYHRENPLHVDVLVVDEASMVDLPMMSKLIAALPQRARLILLGDRDQLASVEAGAVLGDLCRFSEFGYRPERAKQLSELCQTAIPAGAEQPDIAVRDSICLLRKSYRFDANSGIGQLATAVNSGDISAARRCFDGQFSDISWSPMTQDEDYSTLIQTCVEGYRSTLQRVRQQADAAEVLESFSRFRLLCALREGPFGQSGLNDRIELALAKARLIHKPTQAHQRWYSGRPVMVTRNDSSLGLFNGDIGIALADAENNIRVYFQLPDGSIKSVQPSRLPQTETAYAMTVHKSQGSEFEHTLLVLPADFSPIVTRELLYTAITRAKNRLTLFSREQILKTAIRTPTLRRSGLMERMMLPV
ncbi:exodeoxyribonuclease V subunit alpha [Hafnia alvei]|uniref:RecBCD enzyme subunit RecD n=1 Tax=Hafnia alvei TaxID=569 RepID=A0A1C6Z407_HAFAL|nr:exodeoxyribonuclease V subunit alpha [Hafnia alvei]SCM53883.1 DNA helicase/exodeoxyribonuclease V, alpha subunit [Hafnia alvei]